MRFLRRIKGVTLLTRCTSLEIQKSLNFEPLLLQIERSQLRWFGHNKQNDSEKTSKQVVLTKANGKKTVGQPRTRWINVTLRIFGGIAWDFTQAKWWRWLKNVKWGGLISNCCPHYSYRKEGNGERERAFSLKSMFLFAFLLFVLLKLYSYKFVI